ncbi:uncharacterized protein C8Q71DRAFT_684139, partial [Rhodofomes roseus]
DVLFAFNAQHDCYACKCSLATGTAPVQQERRETAQTRQVIKHVGDGPDADRYILNIHALHNAALIRQTLPRSLTAPKPYIPIQERVKKHYEMAAKLQ